MNEPRLRQGDIDDQPALLNMFDQAVAWLVSQGREGQWGSQPWSTDPRRVREVGALQGRGKLWIAEIGATAAGALVLGTHAPDHIPPVVEPERYIHLLITHRLFTGRGIGRILLAHAREQAEQAGVRQLRVDCWAGGDRRLVDYYVQAGFTPTDTFEHRGWPGQVLQHELH